MARLMTTAEIFQAGWDDGVNDAPLTTAEIDRLAPLWRHYLKRNHAAA